jgi:excisionase family DNA binding protein
MTTKETEPITEPEFYTVTEFAAKLRTSKMTVYRMIKNNDIRHYKVGTIVRILPEEYDRITTPNELR